MEDTANRDCRILLDVLMAQGLKEAVLSPGSRNAPILIAASAREELTSHIIADERTAAFVALGIAMASHRPVMLACTSGTALYNYAPAVAEAYYQQIPLIVVSADRPARWIDQDDSQTLRQPGALANIVKRSFNITLGEGENIPTKGDIFDNEREWYVNRTVNEAWIAAVSGRQGPVHINIQLDNPLGEVQNISPQSPRLIQLIQNPAGLPTHIVSELAERLKGKKILITAGFGLPDNELNKAVNRMLALPNVAICAEPISNLHLAADSYTIDPLLKTKDTHILEKLRPDIVISFGGALVSRMLKEFLRKYPPQQHWTLADTDYGVDMFQSLSTHIEVSPAKFFKGISAKLGKSKNNIAKDSYSLLWREMRKNCRKELDSLISTSPWSELTSLHTLLSAMPSNFNLFLSNGTPVRYGALLIQNLPHSCYANRGVSGIDGTSATALGIALKCKSPILLITGDLSFSYAPQIMGLQQAPKNFKIVVINNAGGGIFRFITTTRHLSQREKYFCADSPQPLQSLAQAYGWKYFKADNRERLIEVLPEFFVDNDKPALLEIEVDPQISADILIKALS